MEESPACFKVDNNHPSPRISGEQPLVGATEPPMKLWSCTDSRLGPDVQTDDRGMEAVCLETRKLVLSDRPRLMRRGGKGVAEGAGEGVKRKERGRRS